MWNKESESQCFTFAMSVYIRQGNPSKPTGSYKDCYEPSFERRQIYVWDELSKRPQLFIQLVIYQGLAVELHYCYELFEPHNINGHMSSRVSSCLFFEIIA